jgi:class 3 adenylate cyclase/tetratricopeptide (TPR) repeat protein
MSTVRGLGVGTKTVLFSDVVDSTSVRSSVGDHGADTLDEELRRMHQHSIEGNDGQVVKGLGDGWMAVFDSAASAIAAAIELQVRLRDRNRRRDPAINLRVGVSTGDVSITGDDYLGIPVVEAARLCNAGEGGEILIAEVVRLLAGSRAGGQLIDRGQLDLKGLPAPVQTWQVVWDMVLSTGPPLPTGLEVTDDFAFVGRTQERARMDDMWQRTCRGHLNVLLVGGEPGAGKSRLTAEFAHTVHENGGTILFGSCGDGLAVPYQPFVEALRQVLATSAPPRLGAHPEELIRLVPEISARLPDLPERVSSDPDTERYQLFNAIIDCIVDVAGDAPVLLVLDDLHWATKPTLEMLRHLIRSHVASPVLVLVTFRDTEVNASTPLGAALAEFQQSANAERVTLTGLDTQAIREYLDQIAGYELDDRADRLAERLRQETNGNPFFVREVLLHLVESGHIYLEGDRWNMDADYLTVVPLGARDVIARRLDRLPEDAQMLLSRAAVIGIDFGLKVLEDVTGLDEEVLLDRLEQATDARLVEEVGLDRYRFTHALVRSALVDAISESRRARIHRKIAETLERQAAIQFDLVEDLAEHWAAAGDAGDSAKALMYTRLAAQRAAEQLAYDEAVALLLRALAIGDASAIGEAEKAELLRELGAAQQRAGDPAHRETLLEAARMARRLGDSKLLVRAVLDNARTAAVLDVDADRVELLEDALESAGDSSDSDRARLLANLSFELSFTHDRDRVVRLSDEALQLARSSGSLGDLAFVLSMRVNAFRSPDTLAERLEVCAEIEKVSVELDDPGLRFLAAFRRAEVLMDAGDIDGFRTVVDTMEALTARLRQPMMVWNTTRRMTERELLAGRLDEAARLAETMRARGVDLRLPYADPIYVSLTAKIFEAQGRFDDAAALWAPWIGRIHLIGFRFGFAHALARGGRTAEATAQWELGTAGEFADVDRDLAWLETMGLAADVALFLHDATRAARLHELLAPYEGHIITSGVGAVCTTEHAIGVAALASGQLDEAVSQLSTAAHVGATIGAPLLHASSLTRLGMALQARGATGDVAEAGEALARALDIARAHAAEGLVGDAAALLPAR